MCVMRQDESITHLFFECPLSRCVWNKVQKSCLLYRGCLPWEQELDWWHQHGVSDSFATKIKRLALVATVWHERNRRIFKPAVTNTEQLQTEISRAVQMVIVSWPEAPRTKENWQLVLEWGLSIDCLM